MGFLSHLNPFKSTKHLYDTIVDDPTNIGAIADATNDGGFGGGLNYSLYQTKGGRKVLDPAGIAPSTQAIGTSGKASDIWARITRDQWEDFKRSVQPMEDNVMNEATYNNPGVLDIAQQEGADNVNSFMDAADQAQQVRQAGYGINVSERATNANSRLADIERTKALVGAANRIATNYVDRNRAIALGSDPNLTNQFGLGS